MWACIRAFLSSFFHYRKNFKFRILSVAFSVGVQSLFSSYLCCVYKFHNRYILFRFERCFKINVLRDQYIFFKQSSNRRSVTFPWWFFILLMNQENYVVLCVDFQYRFLKLFQNFFRSLSNRWQCVNSSLILI